MYLLRYPVQRSLSHTNPSLTRIRPQSDFDSMWRGSALFSVAAGHRLDVARGEVEERIAERQQQQHAAAAPQQSQSAAGSPDLRKQLRKPVAAKSGKPLGFACERTSADSTRSLAPQPRVSRLVARLSGAGRLTAFWGWADAQPHSANRRKAQANFSPRHSGRLSWPDSRSADRKLPSVGCGPKSALPRATTLLSFE